MKPEHRSPLADAGLTAALDGTKADKLGSPYVRAALEALENGDYIAAQKGFNRALKFDPTNSQLHFLNGLTYHLRAEAGDTSQREYAAIGYQLALEYDQSNIWAAYQLGHLNFGDRRYREAQDAFAYALTFSPENPTLLKALATASYYAQDLPTAYGALKRAERVAPGDTGLLRLAALTEAAGGQFDAARAYMERYGKAMPSGDNRQVNHLWHRINDWKRLYRGNGLKLAQATTSDVLGDSASTPGLAPPSSDDSSSSDTTSSDDSSATPAPAATEKGTSDGPPQMAMVDVVIIRSEERRSTDKGVNILSGLTATLGGTTVSYTHNRVFNRGSPDTLTRTFLYNPTLSLAATYSLNIFNDNIDHNEVLARPSLIALDDKKSEFFTGAVFHVELDGVSGSSGTVTDVPVGIRLNVTPHFIDKDTVELEVEAGRAYLEGRSSQVNFNNFAQITKTLVTANVAVKFGDTLIISGLTEKETEKLNDGVPFLRDLPGIQYLFSHEDTLDTTKSIIILLTPRKPRYTYTDGTAKRDPKNPTDKDVKQPNLDELKGQVGWFRPAPNIDAVFQHLSHFRFFKEFRAGDVTLETWSNPVELKERIRRSVEYLYY